MPKSKAFIAVILLLSVWTTNHSLVAYAASFSDKVTNIRTEINRDNLKDAIKLLQKIKVGSENEQEQIDLLFGDIYLKINKPSKAEEFYEKSFMTSDARIENLTFVGLAEVKLRQGQLDKAIDFAEKSLVVNSDNVRPKILLALAKTRIGEKEEALDILTDLYDSQSDNADVNLAIAGYHSSFDNNTKAIEILDKYLKSNPTSIKVMDELGNLYWLTGNKDKALELKFKVLKHYEFNKNKYQVKKIKNWILSIEPTYFDKKPITRGIKPKQSEEYEKEEVIEYDDKKQVPHYEEFDFAYNFTGSGFIVGKGKYVITNNHVIMDATRIAVRNGLGKISKASVEATSDDYDLAILKLDSSYNQKYAISSKNFADPAEGDDVISIGYPMSGFFGNDKPVITQGIVSKVFDDKIGLFLTTTDVNSGNSGGPIFNLNGKLVGITVATLDKKKVMKKTGNIPTSMGIAIKSNMLKEVFNYKKTLPISKTKYEKSSIYQQMLPSVVFIAIEVDTE